MMPRLGAAEVPAIGAAATAAARSQFEDLGAAALSQCAAEAIGAATGIGATVSVRQRSAPPLLARPLLAVLRTAVTATTPTATGFAATNPSSLALGAQPASTSRIAASCGRLGLHGLSAEVRASIDGRLIHHRQV